MKKLFIAAIALILMLSFVILPVSGETDAKIYNWYCVRKSGHLQPSCEPSMRFIENCGGYYIDKKHGDNCAE